MDIEIVSQKAEMDGHVLRVRVVVSDGARAKLVDEACRAIAEDTEMDPSRDSLRRDLIKRFGAKQVATDVTSHVSAAAAGEVSGRLGLEVMFPPEFKTETIDEIFDKGPVEQEIEFVLQPHFELSSYEPVYVKIEPTKVTELQVNSYLQSLADEHASFERANGLIADGDYLLVDMTTEVNGKVDDKLSGQHMTIQLEYGKMPDAFVNNVVGMTVGSTKLFDFTLADENGPQGFHVDVTVRDRMRKVSPKLDDAFIKENYSDMGSTLAEARAHARELLEAHAGFQDKQQRELAADAELAGRLTEPIPDIYIEKMSKDVYNRLKESLEQQGMTVKDYMEREDMNERQFQMSVMSQARDALHQGFALDALFEHLDLELDDDDIDRALDELAPGRQDEARKFFEENGTWSLVTQMAKRLKAHDWVMETARFENK